MHPRETAISDPDRPAIVMTGSGETMTYGVLEQTADRIAHFLRAKGLVAGDVIAVMMENCPELLAVCWAAQRSGIYWTPVSSKLVASELSYILSDSDCRLLFSSEAMQGVLDALRATHHKLPVIVARGALDGYPALSDCLRGLPDGPITDEAQGTDMLYSSGTTGRPKGIKRPLPTGPIDEVPPLVAIMSDVFNIPSDPRYLCPAPLYHAAPLRWSMAIHSLGGTLYVMEKFGPEAALAAIERYKIRAAQFVPTHFVRMLKLDEAQRKLYNLSSLTSVVHAAAPCPAEIKRAMIDWLGPVIYEYYSSTEGNGFCAINSQEWLDHPGSVGRALIGTLYICDDQGEPVQARTEGQIFFEGGWPVSYHNDGEKTAASHNRHGWSTIGDIGWVDDERFLYLTDRKSFMIISGGVNIYPQEIEDRLIAHPKVRDAAVIGVPDPDLGERVVAVIQPEDTASAGQEFEQELLEYLSGHLSRVKIPRQFDFVAELPRQETGKLNKRVLLDIYQ